MSHRAHCACPPKTTQQSNKRTMMTAMTKITTTTKNTTTMTRQGQSRPCRCWTADAVGLICFLFGLGFVEAEDDDAVVVIVVVGSNSLFSEVKLDSDAESSSMPTKTTVGSCLHHRLVPGGVLLAGAQFRLRCPISKIQPESWPPEH
jgi:hypothetical protein